MIILLVFFLSLLINSKWFLLEKTWRIDLKCLICSKTNFRLVIFDLYCKHKRTFSHYWNAFNQSLLILLWLTIISLSNTKLIWVKFKDLVFHNLCESQIKSIKSQVWIMMFSSIAFNSLCCYNENHIIWGSIGPIFEEENEVY